MRKFTLALMSLAAVFATGAASAADLPRKAPMPAAVVAPAFSWTGFYIGVNAGYGWGDATGTFAGVTPGSLSMSGGLFGAQVGANYQFVNSPFVIGIEADYQWANIERDRGLGLFGAEVDRFGTVRFRGGFAWDRFMIYGTGGWATVHTDVTFAPVPGLSFGSNRSGWTAGGGVEWAFAPNWSAKLEYLHIDLDDRTFLVAACLPLGCRVSADIDLVRVGVNWRFGGGWWR